MSKTFYVAVKNTIKDGRLVSYTLAREDEEYRAMEACHKRSNSEYTGAVYAVIEVNASDRVYEYASERYKDDYDAIVDECCCRAEDNKVKWISYADKPLSCSVYDYTETVDGISEKHRIWYDDNTDGMTVAEFLVWYIEDGDEGENIEFLDDNSVKFIRDGKTVCWSGEKIDLDALYDELYDNLKESEKMLSVD